MSLGEERLGAEAADGDGEARGEERELPAILCVDSTDPFSTCVRSAWNGLL
jgi:hypothetical protein